MSYYFGQAVHSSQKIPVGLVFVIKAGSQVLDAHPLGVLSHHIEDQRDPLYRLDEIAGFWIDNIISHCKSDPLPR